MPDHSAARSTIVAVLTDVAINRIRINLRGVTITPTMIREIRDLTRAGQIDVEHVPGQSTPAIYNSNENKFYLNFSRTGRMSQRALIIHEAIHAACDRANFDHMLINTSEAAAYIGQCVYMIVKENAGQGERLGHEDPTRDRVFELAWGCARTIASGGQPSHSDIEQLRSAILQHPYYSQNGTQNAGYNGISWSLSRACGL
mgnify:CR=1 FL=1